MMLGTSSSSLADAAAAAAAAAEAAHDSGGSGEVGGGAGSIPGGFSDEERGGRIEEGERGAAGGNRWPRQETLALLKIRSEMGVAFRDSSLKGPLWEEVSRKMAELHYQRSAKKCKEKFENVYKYHKRTKEGRASKPDGKTYRFFDQLEALENNPSQLPLPPPQPRPLQHTAPPQPSPMATTTTAAMAAPMPTTTPITSHNITVSSPNPVSFSPSVNHPIISSLPSSHPQPQPQPPLPINLHQTNTNVSTSLMSDSTSSSTSSDEDIGRRHKRKRKFKDFFERLMKDVIEKQEELQRKFLETLEKRERDRMIREEAWRVQEMARMNRELDLLAQERSMAASKDATVMQLLQKITAQQQNLQTPITNVPSIPIPVHNIRPPENPSPQPISVAPAITQAPSAPATAPPVTQIMPQLQPPVAAAVPVATPTRNVDTSMKTDNGGENFMAASSSRWPKTEVQALIKLRTNLDMKYQESGPKGPLWEEISSGMSKIGYNRSAKRCKEKWENINKYFKKVKESNKKRPEDSKTCPYFHLLDALYKEKAKADVSYNSSSAYTNAIKPDNPMVPIMARPEQQWPLPQDRHHQDHTAMEDHESDNIDQNDHDDEDDGDDEDEEDEGGGYEIVTNKPSSVATTTAE